MNISVIGLGKLGAPLLVALASKNNQVFGVDINKNITDKLEQGISPLVEPGLQEMLTKYKENIHITDVQTAVTSSDLTFILTATPSLKDGSFSTHYVEDVIREISAPIKNKNSYHLVVLVSTLMPGSTDAMQKLLEEESGKSCGDALGICYNPEFIALGNVIKGLLNPDFVLIGQSDKKAGDILENLYNNFCENSPQIARMNFVNAELTKISVNTYVTIKISYANMLAEICESLPGGDVDQVTIALGMDTRIGKKYLQGGLSYGGPCFPRDNRAFVALAKKSGASFELPLATDETNHKQITRLIGRISSLDLAGKSIGVIGMAYKSNTDVIEESAGFYLVSELLNKKLGQKINIYDQLALENSKKIFSEGCNYFDSLQECVYESDVLIFTIPWREVSELSEEVFGDKVVIDPWRMLKNKTLPKSCRYIPFGKSLG